MSNPIVIGLVGVAIALVVILATRRSGPRVTTIETRRDKANEGGDR